MSDNKPKTIAEFPLAENHTNRIRWSRHVKDRMMAQGVTSSQILTLLKNRHAVFREGPYPEPNGDWKFNLKGKVAGDIIELVVALINHHDDPSSTLVTVWIK